MNVFYPSPPSDEVVRELQELVGNQIRVSKDLNEVPNFEALIEGRLTNAHLQLSRKLRFVIVPFAGVPEKTISVLSRSPEIELFNLHHNAADTAEMALTLMFSAAKAIVPADRLLRAGNWTPRYEPARSVLLNGKTVLVLGWGSIGRRFGAVCEALGMEVLAVNRSGEGAYPVKALDELLPRANAVVVTLPLTEETNGLLDERRLALLPQGAILVNVARAEIVAEEALYRALASGRLHSAGLDVWYRYPAAAAGVPSYFSMPESALHTFPSEFPFHELDNVVLSPHRGGVSMDTEKNRVKHLAETLLALQAGKMPPNKVNRDLGY